MSPELKDPLQHVPLLELGTSAYRAGNQGCTM